MAEQARFTGQTYGEGARQQASQRVVPVGPPPTEPGGGMQMTPLGAPTERPNEPITAGLPMGAGPGPEALSPIAIAPGSREDLILQLRAAASRYPNPALIRFIAEMERQ